MANMPVAHGTITILDFADTATYIYYAKDSSGSGAQIAPGPSLGYIGIYSGPTLPDGQPQVDENFSQLIVNWGKQWSGWLQLTGSRGYNCTEKVYYAVSDSSEMPPIDGSGATLEPFEVLESIQGEYAVDFLNGAMYYFEFKVDPVTGEQTLGAKQDDNFIGLVSGNSLELAGASDVWKPYIPSLEMTKGKWLWAKHCREYGDGSADIWYSVSRDGFDGRGIGEIKEFYCVNKSDQECPQLTNTSSIKKYQSKDPLGDGCWYSTTPPMDVEYQFLWNCEEIIYTDGEPQITEPALIASLPGQLLVQYVSLGKDETPDENTEWLGVMPALSPNTKIMMRQKLSTALDWSTPVQISGEDGIGRDGAGTEFIYILRTKEQGAPEAPDDDQELGPDKGDWSDHPLGVDENYQYEYVSVRTKEEGATQWGEYSEPAVLSKWGENGRDADTLIYIYSTAEEADRDYPTVTIDTDGARTFSKGWEDDMPGLSATTPVVYGSTVTVPPDATDTTIEGTTPVVWARWGQDGKGIEIRGAAYAFPGTSVEEGKKYPLYSDDQGANQIEPQIGDSYVVDGYLLVYNGGNEKEFLCVGKIQGPGVSCVINYYGRSQSPATVPTTWVVVGRDQSPVDMPQVSADWPYLWNRESVIFSDGRESEPTPWVIIGTFGAFLEVMYSYANSMPTKPTNGSTVGWYDSPATAGAQGNKKGDLLYMVQKNSTETVWSDPMQISGEKGIGQDGASIKFVFFPSESATAPTTKPTIDKTTGALSDSSKKSGWYESPQGVSESRQYEYMSQSTKAAGVDTKWGDCTTPVLWSKWGERGLDADGLEYYFMQMTEESAPTSTPECSWNGETWDIEPNGWTPDPSGVSADIPFEYVVKIVLSADGSQASLSKPKLWAKYGQNGTGVTIRGSAYSLEEINDATIGRNLILYVDEDCAVELDQAKQLQLGDAYIAQGYLFVCTETTMDDGKLQCAGKIQGVKGDDGNSVSIIGTWYKQTKTSTQPDLNSAEWLTTLPEPQAGHYLWTWFRLADTNGNKQDSLCVSYQGVNGNGYDIETNCDNLYYYSLEDGSRLSEFALDFTVYALPRKDNEPPQPLSSNEWELGVITPDGAYEEVTSDYVQIGVEHKATYVYYSKDGTLVSNEYFQDANQFSFYTGEAYDFEEPEFLEWQANGQWSGWMDIQDVTAEYNSVSGLYTVITYPNTVFVRVSEWQDDSPEDFPEVGSAFKFKFSAREKADGDFKEVANKIISYENGVTPSQVTFEQTLNSINMAIADKYLTFDKDGLSLYLRGSNGKLRPKNQGGSGLRIFRVTTDENDQETKERVFWADAEGNLNLKGTVYATDGQFTGEIFATNGVFESGWIGDFSLKDGRLTSTDGKTLIIDGFTGEIEANQITLGKHAKVADCLVLQDNEEGTGAILCNPLMHSGLVLQSGGLKIYNTGQADFGNIKIDSAASAMYAKDPVSGRTTWYLSPEVAEFQNVNVHGTIATSVFKANTTQAVGGAMLFMNSYRIESIEEVDGQGVLHLAEECLQKSVPDKEEFKVWLVQNNDSMDFRPDPDDFTTIIGDSYHLYTIDKIEGKKITLKEKIVKGQGDEATTIIFIGVTKDFKGQPTTPPLIFGVNSGDSSVADGLLPARGLTLAEYEEHVQYKANGGKMPKLFLGDLSQLRNGEGDSPLQGYGLYCDNVHLMGALTTKTSVGTGPTVGSSNTYYAGVSTNNGAINTIPWVDKELSKDETQIVFWAGAQGVSNEKVQQAPFQVTEQGSLYAQQAYLPGAIVSGGIIRGARIYTAELFGSGNGEAALKIYDQNDATPSAIDFYLGQKPKLRICSEGIKRTWEGEIYSSLVSLTNDETVVFANVINMVRPGQATDISCLTLTQNAVCFCNDYDKKNEPRNGFYFDNDKIKCQISSGSSLQTRTLWSSNETKIVGNLALGEEGTDTMIYRVARGGYDLYVASA